jgi:hypothetical protein
MTWTNNTNLKDLDYADDLALIGESLREAEVMTQRLAVEARKVGLEISRAKTKVMKVFDDDPGLLMLDEEELESVEWFQYLGSTICADGDIRREMRIRVGKAGASFSKMKKVWTKSGMSLITKLRLFNSIVISILLYGCETWKGLKEIETKFRRFESNCLRKIMKIKWYEHVSEEEVRRRSGQQSVVEKIRYHRWRYYGHVLRMDEDRLPRQILEWQREGTRRVGRPKDTWRRTMERYMRNNNLVVEEVEECALDRAR